MRKVLTTFLILILSISFVGCSKSTIGTIVKQGNKDFYVNQKYKFRFEIPEFWGNKYEFKEKHDDKNKKLENFQVNFVSKENNKSNIDVKLYVLNKLKVQKIANKSGKDIKTYLKENKFGVVIDENSKSIFSAVELNIEKQ